MEMSMRRATMMMMMTSGALCAALACATPAAAEESPAKPKCQVAEINPVTGHVFCIRPQGAPVEAPPEDIAPACNEDESRGQWTWAPNCRPAKGS
jgi:hypothetical protein